MFDHGGMLKGEDVDETQHNNAIKSKFSDRARNSAAKR